jgi:hypothetical protein
MKCKYCTIESIASYCSEECRDNHVVFGILENLTEDLDLIEGATTIHWNVNLTKYSYDALKNRPGTQWDCKKKEYLPRNLIYQKDGKEWLICWENNNIPFVVHAIICNRDSSFDYLEQK